MESMKRGLTVMLLVLAGPALAQPQPGAPEVPANPDQEAAADEVTGEEPAADDTGGPMDGGEPTETEEAETSAVPARPTIEDTDYAVRLRGLEEQVNDLKERIFRSKARLLLLKETVLNGVISGARARIIHRNDMGSAFRLEEVQYALDGSPLLSRTADGGDLDAQREIELFNGSIVPGNHNLSAYLLFRGNGYGVFSYLRGYTFKIQSSYAFVAEEGKLTTVRAVAYERGGFTTDLQNRVALRYDVEAQQDVRTAESESDGGGPAGDGGEPES
jgi:hypothetical protein